MYFSCNYLSGSFLWNLSSEAPNLLELHPELVKSLCNDGNEDILDEPGEEEDHGGEEEGGTPGGQGVDGAIHDEHPALLRHRLIHREDARG